MMVFFEEPQVLDFEHSWLGITVRKGVVRETRCVSISVMK